MMREAEGHRESLAQATRLQHELERLAADLEARAGTVRARAGEAGALAERLGELLASAPAEPPPAAEVPRQAEPIREPASLGEWLARGRRFAPPPAVRDSWRARLLLSPATEPPAVLRVLVNALCGLAGIGRPEGELLGSRVERNAAGATLRSEGVAAGGALAWAARLQQPRAEGGYRSTEVAVRYLPHAAEPAVLTLRSHSYNGPPEAVPEVAPLLRLTSALAERGALASIYTAEPLDDAAAAERLARRLHDAQRREALVLVSPRAHSEHYLLDPDQLALALAGVARVVRIGPQVDSYELGELLGETYIAFNGAIAVMGRAEGSRPRCHRYLSRDLEAFASPAEALRALLRTAQELALPTLPDHLRPEEVREAAMRFAPHPPALPPLPLPIEPASAPSPAAAAPPDPREREIDRLSAALEQLRQAEREREGERATLRSALLAATRPGPDGMLTPHAARAALLHAALPLPTPAEALAATLLLFPERLVLLDSAWRSAERSAAFTRGDRLLELLLALAGPFWEALAAGTPENEARQVLGSAYVPRESDTVSGNRRARELRTFVYEGEPLVMERHLRIGTKPSITETLRVHFHWDAERARLVVGHCGEHLDHG